MLQQSSKEVSCINKNCCYNKNMTLFLSLLIVVAIGLTVYFFKQSSSVKAEDKGVEAKISELEHEIEKIKEERDKLKEECESLANQLNEKKKEESDLYDQLARTKEWYAKNQEALEKVKKENLELRNYK
ncbi:MAG: hypothetical protein NC935_04800 [Candidatus Omnitrophica bacterium]|nr:hypothetical protein [Candidatus Omnitrophota bacterium]